MRVFESDVQRIRYKIYKEIIQRTKASTFEASRHRIPKEMLPSSIPLSRCCVYKEREIISERINLAADPIEHETGVIATIESACDECSEQRYIITDSCRGCFAHRCVQACKRQAIEIIDGKSHIDYSKCVSCGKCKEVCAFNAIVDALKPCMKACKSNAIHIKEDKKIEILYDKCTSCGACVYQCPFGAISDRSEIISIVKALEGARNRDDIHMYAVIAPAIVTQYNAKIGQIVAAIKQIGFKDVVEAALGADMVASQESLEFIERVVKGNESCMMTSCCPAFTAYVKIHYPMLTSHLSTMVSPMIAVSRFIKQVDSKAQIIFIGPCTAKKEEKRLYDTIHDTDYVMTFEELEALLDAYDIDIESYEPEPLNNASYFGRLFARSGGVTDAITSVIKESGLTLEAFRPLTCNGIQEVDKALKLLKVGKNTFNFVEGMACIGGCIGGAACLTHEAKQAKKVEEYAKLALEKNVKDALRVMDYSHLDLHKQGNH